MPIIHHLSRFQAHESVCWYASWSPDGNEIITSSADKSVKIWGRMGDSWVLKETLDGIHTKSIRACEVSPNGKFLAAASFDSNISIYKRDNDGWSFFTMLEGHVNEVKNVSWSRDSQLLASSSRDRNVIVWGYNEEDDEMDCVSVLSGHTQDVKFVRFSTINNNLYSCSYDDTIKVWYYEGEDFTNINTLRAHEGTVWGLAFKAIKNNQQNLLEQEEKEEEPLMYTTSLDDDHCMEVEVADDTRIINEFVSCGMDSRVIYWKEVEDNIGNSEDSHKVILSGCNNDEPYYSIDWNENGVIVAGGNNTMHLLSELKEGDFVNELEMVISEADVNCLRWNPIFTNQFVSCGDDGVVNVWEVVFFFVCFTFTHC